MHKIRALLISWDVNAPAIVTTLINEPAKEHEVEHANKAEPESPSTWEFSPDPLDHLLWSSDNITVNVTWLENSTENIREDFMSSRFWNKFCII